MIVKEDGLEMNGKLIPWRKWISIPGYNGYELQISDYCNNYGLKMDKITGIYAMIRSTKNFNKYPTGYIIGSKLGKKKGLSFVISNNDCEPIRLCLLEIINIIANDPYSNVTVVPDNLINISSRNKVKSGEYMRKMAEGKEEFKAQVHGINLSGLIKD